MPSSSAFLLAIFYLRLPAFSYFRVTTETLRCCPSGCQTHTSCSTAWSSTAERRYEFPRLRHHCQRFSQMQPHPEMLLLLSFFYFSICSHKEFLKQSTPRQKKNCLRNFDLSEHRQILSDLAIHIYHQFITVMQKTVTPAIGILHYNHILTLISEMFSPDFFFFCCF